MKLSIEKETMVASCNSCTAAANYDFNHNGNVTDIYAVRIGAMCNLLCGDCLKALVRMIDELEI